MASSNLFNPKTLNTNKEFIQRISSWVEEIISNEKTSNNASGERESFSVMVTEVSCNEPDCVPIETFIVVIGSHGKKYSSKIPKPVRDVVKADVEYLIGTSTIFKVEGIEALSEEYVNSLADSFSKNLFSNLLFLREPNEKKRLLDLLSNRILEEKIKVAEHEKETEDESFDDMPPLEEEIQPLVNPSAQVSLTNTTYVSMKPILPSNAMSINPKPMIAKKSTGIPPIRHEKGIRGPRGCPCCDPDNIENITDKILFLDCPP